MHEMNQTLAKRAGSVTNFYRTAKGRARDALNDRVKKFHIFEGQVKSSQDLYRKIIRLESEINEWKTTRKNIERKKRNYSKKLLTLIEQKDTVISHLNTNKQLEDYVANLEKNYLSMHNTEGSQFLRAKTKKEH